MRRVSIVTIDDYSEFFDRRTEQWAHLLKYNLQCHVEFFFRSTTKVFKLKNFAFVSHVASNRSTKESYARCLQVLYSLAQTAQRDNEANLSSDFMQVLKGLVNEVIQSSQNSGRYSFHLKSYFANIFLLIRNFLITHSTPRLLSGLINAKKIYLTIMKGLAPLKQNFGKIVPPEQIKQYEFETYLKNILLMISPIYENLSSKSFDLALGTDLYGSLPAMIYAHEKQIPFVYDAHEFYSIQRAVLETPYSHLTSDLEKIVIVNCSLLMGVTDELSSLMLKAVNKKPNCISLFNLPSWTTDVITHGRNSVFREIRYHGVFAKNRNLEYLIELFDSVSKELPKWRFSFQGYGDTLGIRHKIIKLANEKLFLVEPVPREKLQDSIRDLDAIIIPYTEADPNLEYSFPNKLGDAVVMKLPIVYNSQLKSVASLFRHNELVIAVNFGSPEAPKQLIDALNKIDVELGRGKFLDTDSDLTWSHVSQIFTAEIDQLLPLKTKNNSIIFSSVNQLPLSNKSGFKNYNLLFLNETLFYQNGNVVNLSNHGPANPRFLKRRIMQMSKLRVIKTPRLLSILNVLLRTMKLVVSRLPKTSKTHKLGEAPFSILCGESCFNSLDPEALQKLLNRNSQRLLKEDLIFHTCNLEIAKLLKSHNLNAKQISCREFSQSSVPLNPSPRFLIGIADTAGQASEWRGAIESNYGSSAHSFALNGAVPFGIPVHKSIETLDYYSGRWAKDIYQFLKPDDVIVWESGRKFFGEFAGLSRIDQYFLLKSLVANVGLVFHGADIANPKRFLAKKLPNQANLEIEQRKNRKLLEIFEGPLFVTTPDLLEELPDAHYLPLTVKPARTMKSGYVRERIPKVVHIPSNPVIKGTEFIMPVMMKLHEAGRINFQYRTNISHEQVLREIEQADILIDQCILGSYGRLAVEAMNCGVVTIAYLSDITKKLLPHDFPVIDCGPKGQHLLDAILRAISIYDIDLERKRFQTFAQEYHDGRKSAQVILSSFGII